MPKGRPKSPVQAADPDVKRFFEACDRLGLSTKELHSILSVKLPRAPSYRTLQEWRRGTHTPKFAPFSQWLEILRERNRKK